MQPLDPLSLRLQGQILIEASAGTGKTYTIGLLFLRLLLERGLSVDEILVVTFTKAATEELRGRIRQRLREALDALDGHGCQDATLQQYLGSSSDPEKARTLLADGLTRMDEAAIFTIHSFCQQMLQEHAFESGAPFEMEFLESEQHLRSTIIEDFWRQRFYSAADHEAVWAASLWQSPGKLLTELGGHLNEGNVHCLPDIDRHLFAGQVEALGPLFEQVRTMWQESGRDIAGLLRDNRRISRDGRTGYRADRLALALAGLERFLAADEMAWRQPELSELFTTGRIRGSLLKNNQPPPEHPFFDLFDNFLTLHRAMTASQRILVLQEARTFLRHELEQRKNQQGLLYFDDLLSRLDTGLQGRGGERLAQRISRRFPAILVDEFQDTDPLQYRIFASIHAAGDRGSGLFLIGDPKQAIYGFRGADIFTYIQARRDTKTENRYTMTTNYRSTSSMVAAVNLLFDREAPFLFHEIGFAPVSAAGFTDNELLVLNGEQVSALNCLLLPEAEKGGPLAKETAGQMAARSCAHEIAYLLAGGMAGTARIGERPLFGGDIAVLVRTHAEAELMRRELSLLDIVSVSYSQASVFVSGEALQLAGLMAALLDLTDPGLIRTSLTGDLFGYNAARLDLLSRDEHLWEEVVTTLSRYLELWQQGGVSVMFQQLLAEQQVVSRLYGTSSGERSLTNFLHLVELLQEAAQLKPGPDELLRWLHDQIRSTEDAGDKRQLRLESDENLVKIVTIHKAKGLEYPVVFLPFLWSTRPCQRGEPLVFHRREQLSRLYLDLGSGREDHYRAAEEERLAADLRLLYVAMTRARTASFFCWGTIRGMEQSGLHALLHGDSPSGQVPSADGPGGLDAPPTLLSCKAWPDHFSSPRLSPEEDSGLLSVARFTGRIDSDWRIISYSRLTALHEQRPERPDHDQAADAVSTAPGQDRFGFPRGAAAGTCLHAILEQIDFTRPAGHEQIINEQLAHGGFDLSWTPVVAEWMDGLLGTGMEEGHSLARIHNRDRINEMSFSFPLHSVQPDHLNRVLERFSYGPLPGGEKPEQEQNQKMLQGLMVGFIDLVYRVDGRYYIADYKSNHLGNAPEDYGQAEMAAAMLAHRYDLQYLIYSLALHRYLAGRIRGYDYELHFGGVRYLFLRGMAPENIPGTGIVSARPPLALITELDHCCRGGEVS